jgi:hypothetical protein
VKRGTFEFEVTPAGDIVNDAGNVERLRKLWLDRSMIDGDDLGPGDAGDFDYGAWHVACHLVGAGGVRRTLDGRLLWLEVSHDPAVDEYYGSVSEAGGAGVRTHRIDSEEGRKLLAGSTLLGFVEGNSVGRISARKVQDPPTQFNGWTRQQFNNPAGSTSDGGKVWEHWCTVRDIRTSHRIGSSVLRAYVALVSALGDRFVATVTRGRRSYGHPKQLCAMVRAGLTSESSATWDVTPDRIPDDAEQKFLEATPGDGLAAAAMLRWDGGPRYYMFARRIGSWSDASQVRDDLRAFGEVKRK